MGNKLVLVVNGMGLDVLVNCPKYTRTETIKKIAFKELKDRELVVFDHFKLCRVVKNYFDEDSYRNNMYIQTKKITNVDDYLKGKETNK